MSFIKLGSKMFNVGSIVTLNDKAKNHIPGVWSGLTVILHRLGNNDHVGLYSPDTKIDGWSDLDGEVGSYRGWWIDIPTLALCVLDADDSEFEVKKTFVYRGIDLKGKTCRIIARFGDKKTVFVEFEEHVNGCSADGMGKAGHCVGLNSNILTKKQREKDAK